MTTMRPPKYGDAFLMSVIEGRLDGGIESEDLGLIRRCSQERALVNYVAAEVQEYGGGQRIYICIPIGRVWSDAPHSDDDEVVYEVKIETAETLFERMAAAAAAMEHV